VHFLRLPDRHTPLGKRHTWRPRAAIVGAIAVGCFPQRGSVPTEVPPAWVTIGIPELRRTGNSRELRVISTLNTGDARIVLVRCQSSALNAIEAFDGRGGTVRWPRPCRLDEVHSDTIGPNRVIVDTGTVFLAEGQLKEVEPGASFRASYGTRLIAKNEKASQHEQAFASMLSNTFTLRWPPGPW
jgi:hypothetical protein